MGQSGVLRLLTALTLFVAACTAEPSTTPDATALDGAAPDTTALDGTAPEEMEPDSTVSEDTMLESTTETTLADPEPKEWSIHVVSFSSPSELWRVGPTSEQRIGPIQANEEDLVLTDVAQLPGTTSLIAITFEAAYLVDPATAEALLLGSIGFGGVNALTVLDDGRVVAATTEGAVLQLDPETGAGTLIGTYGSGFVSSGDMSLGPDGRLYASVGRNPDVLVVVDPTTGTASPTDAQIPSDTWGLSWVGPQLYGLSSERTAECEVGALHELSVNGPSTLVRCLPFVPGGAANPTGSGRQ